MLRVSYWILRVAGRLTTTRWLNVLLLLGMFPPEDDCDNSDREQDRDRNYINGQLRSSIRILWDYSQRIEATRQETHPRGFESAAAR